MPNASKTARAAIGAAALGIGVVRIMQAERYYRRKLILHATEMHQAWLSEVASNEALRAIWTAPGAELPSDEYANLVHCNRQVSLLSAKFRVGLLNRRTLRVQAQWLMNREVGRTYWREFGSFRELEAQDRLDRAFNQILADEYVALCDPGAVAA